MDGVGNPQVPARASNGLPAKRPHQADARSQASRPRVTPGVRWGRGPASARLDEPVSVTATLRSPFVTGFVGALGVLAAVVLGVALASLSTILISIGAALFIALGLDPVVRMLVARGLRRPLAIGLVFVALTVIAVLIVLLVFPVFVRQIVAFAQLAPGYLVNLEHQDWFIFLSDQLGIIDLPALFEGLIALATDPASWLFVGSGLVRVGVGLINGVTGAMIVLILSLYFLASLDGMKKALYALVPRPRRPGFIDISEQITGSIGGYVNGMLLLSCLNSGLGLVAMLIIGVPFAGVLAIVVFALALVPLIGSVFAAAIVVAVALLASPATALWIGLYYLVYLQIEAYVLTPRVMNKAIAVPGSLVVIGAIAGGALLGMLGALIAIPVTASILLIIKTVVVPRQDRVRA
ncbi:MULTISPECIES: AI-2E family transporter [unclassified Cryobacterium]|uniref:AI-2E family transporter n=1 Tax=unclassified Cryobacterium TaxID=2649013 RepID=UPI002B23DB65|nr:MULTISPECIES: AI-2E family transporter [unclassified Cryobacterium]MEB0000972.1 AI-2E family transporter [Cryobacterium sp. RTS3]MEB0267541.1 AI-2E family transporter [Cryobacterium sp. 10I5]